MSFLTLLFKAQSIERELKTYITEKEFAIKIHSDEKPKYNISDKYRHYCQNLKKKLTNFFCFCSFIPKTSFLHRFIVCLRTEGTLENYILKSIIGFVGGIFLTYLFFLFFVFQLNFKLSTATIMCSIIGSILTIGLAFNSKVRCVTFLLLPQFFSKRGRQALMAYTFILALTGPAKNTIHNMGILSESLACGQEQLKAAVKQILEIIKKPFYAIKDAIKTVIKAVKFIIKKIKDILIKIKRIIMSIVNFIRSAFEWLASIVNICNKKIGTPFQRCMRVMDNAILDCNAKLGPLFSWLCSVTYVAQALCYTVKFLDLICTLLDFINDSIIGVILRKVKIFVRHIRTMFYVRIQFSHSFHFETNQSKSIKEIAQGIITEIQKRTEGIIAVFNIMSCATSFFFLFIILKVMHYRHTYLTNERFDNKYITNDLIDIDFKRAKLYKETILPLNRRETNQYANLSSLQLIPEEKVQLSKSAVFLGMVTLKLCTHMIADYSLFWVLAMIRRHGQYQSTIESNFAGVHVAGKGILADLYKTIVKAFQPMGLKMDVDSVPCLPDPIPPDFDRYIQIGTLIGLCWLLAIFEPYGLRLRHKVMTLYHPQRAKQRAVWLYNHILRSRMSFLKMARRQLRIKYKGGRSDKVTCLEYLRANTNNKCLILFLGQDKKRMCLLCGEVERESNKKFFFECNRPNCVGFYCKDCFKDMENICTLCLDPIEYGDISDMSEEFDSSDVNDSDVRNRKKLKKKKKKRSKKKKDSYPKKDDGDGDDDESPNENTILIHFNNDFSDTDPSNYSLKTETTDIDSQYDYDELKNNDTDTDITTDGNLTDTSGSQTDYSYGYQNQKDILRITNINPVKPSFKDVEKQIIPDFASMDDTKSDLTENTVTNENTDGKDDETCFDTSSEVSFNEELYETQSDNQKSSIEDSDAKTDDGNSEKMQETDESIEIINDTFENIPLINTERSNKVKEIIRLKKSIVTLTEKIGGYLKSVSGFLSNFFQNVNAKSTKKVNIKLRKINVKIKRRKSKKTNKIVTPDLIEFSNISETESNSTEVSNKPKSTSPSTIDKESVSYDSTNRHDLSNVKQITSPRLDVFHYRVFYEEVDECSPRSRNSTSDSQTNDKNLNEFSKFQPYAYKREILEKYYKEIRETRSDQINIKCLKSTKYVLRRKKRQQNRSRISPYQLSSSSSEVTLPSTLRRTSSESNISSYDDYEIEKIRTEFKTSLSMGAFLTRINPFSHLRGGQEYITETETEDTDSAYGEVTTDNEDTVATYDTSSTVISELKGRKKQLSKTSRKINSSRFSIDKTSLAVFTCDEESYAGSFSTNPHSLKDMRSGYAQTEDSELTRRINSRRTSQSINRRPSIKRTKTTATSFNDRIDKIEREERVIDLTKSSEHVNASTPKNSSKRGTTNARRTSENIFRAGTEDGTVEKEYTFVKQESLNDTCDSPNYRESSITDINNISPILPTASASRSRKERLSRDPTVYYSPQLSLEGMEPTQKESRNVDPVSIDEGPQHHEISVLVHDIINQSLAKDDVKSAERNVKRSSGSITNQEKHNVDEIYPDPLPDRLVQRRSVTSTKSSQPQIFRRQSASTNTDPLSCLPTLESIKNPLITNDPDMSSYTRTDNIDQLSSIRPNQSRKSIRSNTEQISSIRPEEIEVPSSIRSVNETQSSMIPEKSGIRSSIKSINEIRSSIRAEETYIPSSIKLANDILSSMIPEQSGIRSSIKSINEIRSSMRAEETNKPSSIKLVNNILSSMIPEQTGIRSSIKSINGTPSSMRAEESDMPSSIRPVNDTRSSMRAEESDMPSSIRPVNDTRSSMRAEESDMPSSIRPVNDTRSSMRAEESDMPSSIRPVNDTRSSMRAEESDMPSSIRPVNDTRSSMRAEESDMPSSIRPVNDTRSSMRPEELDIPSSTRAVNDTQSSIRAEESDMPSSVRPVNDTGRSLRSEQISSIRTYDTTISSPIRPNETESSVRTNNASTQNRYYSLPDDTNTTNNRRFGPSGRSDDPRFRTIPDDTSIQRPSSLRYADDNDMSRRYVSLPTDPGYSVLRPDQEYDRRNRARRRPVVKDFAYQETDEYPQLVDELENTLADRNRNIVYDRQGRRIDFVLQQEYIEPGCLCNEGRQYVPNPCCPCSRQGNPCKPSYKWRLGADMEWRRVADIQEPDVVRCSRFDQAPMCNCPRSKVSRVCDVNSCDEFRRIVSEQYVQRYVANNTERFDNRVNNATFDIVSDGRPSTGSEVTDDRTNMRAGEDNYASTQCQTSKDECISPEGKQTRCIINCRKNEQMKCKHRTKSCVCEHIDKH